MKNDLTVIILLAFGAIAAIAIMVKKVFDYAEKAQEAIDEMKEDYAEFQRRINPSIEVEEIKPDTLVEEADSSRQNNKPAKAENSNVSPKLKKDE